MTLPASFSQAQNRVREFIRRSMSAMEGTEAEFNRLALTLFTLQYEHVLPYRRLCERRRVRPDAVKEWQSIPAMPTSAFKELELTCLPREDRPRVFCSSGTTEQQPSRHFHNLDSLSLYEQSLNPWFQAHLFPKRTRGPDNPAGSLPVEGDTTGETDTSMPLILLTPPPDQAPHSSLVHMMESVRRRFGAAGTTFSGGLNPDQTWGINSDLICERLGEAEQTGQPVALLGTAFAFLELIDELAGKNQSFQLPPGSRLMETGGYKGRSRSLSKGELHERLSARLSIPRSYIVAEYGMSELGSQAYDQVAGQNTDFNTRSFHFPPWARARIISPETGDEVAEGESGLIRIFDLANLYSISAIQTEDLGIRRPGGFQWAGRATRAEARGCSLMSR